MGRPLNNYTKYTTSASSFNIFNGVRTSRTEPTMIRCCGFNSTPEAVWIFVDSIPKEDSLGVEVFVLICAVFWV